MDTGTGGGRSPGSSLASNSGSICYSSKLSTSKLLQPASRSYGSRSGCYAPELVAPRCIRIPSNCHLTTSFEQNQGVRSMQGHTDHSLVASEGVLGRSLDVGRGTREVACQTGSLTTAPLAQVSFEPPSALSSCLETIQRFARARGVPSDVA